MRRALPPYHIAMQYRIELAANRRAARVDLPGRSLDLEAVRATGSDWDVSVTPAAGGRSGIVTLAAATAADAVWRVARAAVQAYAELTGQTLDEVPRPTPPP
jgi:hypothetical protein